MRSNTQSSGSRAKLFKLVSFSCIIGLLLFLPIVSYGGAGDTLKDLERLTGKEREAKLIEGAKRESLLVYYGTIAIDQSTELLNAFKKQYPFLKTEYYRSGNINVYNKIKTEAQAGKNAVDVIDLRAGETYSLVKDGLVDPYLSPSRKGMMKEFMDEKGYWTAPFHSPMALGYNTNFVKKEAAPRSYEDLLDPKWKGRMSIDVEDADMMGTLIEYWGKEKGVAYFKKLAGNQPSIRQGHTFQAQILAAGEVHVAPWLFGYRPLTMMRKGAPLAIVLLEPILSAANYMLLAKNAPHPYTAALYLDWVLSADGGMKIFAEQLGRSVPRAGMKDKFPELQASSYLAVDPERIGPKFTEYSKLYCSIFGHC
ncbi:MAG TPA: extracellular solute-binding protein [Candidatus Binatia bacterium]|jgi:iron(III) transport system substrate-binding protein